MAFIFFTRDACMDRGEGMWMWMMRFEKMIPRCAVYVNVR